MNPLDDRGITKWAMRAGLTRDEIRRAVREGLDAGDLSWPTVGKTDQQRLERFSTVRDYLGRLTPGEDPMAPWQWRQLPSHARFRWIDSQHVQQFDRDDYGRLQAGPEWVHRKGQEHLFNIRAITDASFLARDPQTGDVLSTWDRSKVMKRIQMLGAHEQVTFTGADTIRGYVRPGPGSPMADEFSRMRSAFIIGGEPGPPGQGYIDPSVGNVTSRRVKDVWARPGERLTGMAQVGQQWLPGEEIKLADQLTGFRDRSWGYEVLDRAAITRQVQQGGETVTQAGHRYVMGQEADLSTARVRMKAYAGKLAAVRQDLSGITDPQGRSLGVQFAGAFKDVQGLAYSHFMARDPLCWLLN